MNRPSTAVENILSVDVEDWFHILEAESGPDAQAWPSLDSRVEANTDRLLATFDEAGARATFFVVGWIAERHPGLVARLVRAGHEVASHSWWHEVVHRHDRASFAADVGATRRRLEDLTGAPVRGFRAPGHSITPATAWAFDVLCEQGYAYDSSLCPGISSHGGYPSPFEGPHRVRCNAGELAEIPSSTASVAGRRIPYAGGGYLRLFPYAVIRACLRADNAAGRPANVYVHPREIDPDQPRLELPWKRRFKYYVGLAGAHAKLERLLREHRFTTAAAWLDAHGAALAGRVLDVRAEAARDAAPVSSPPPPSPSPPGTSVGLGVPPRPPTPRAPGGRVPRADFAERLRFSRHVLRAPATFRIDGRPSGGVMPSDYPAADAHVVGGEAARLPQPSGRPAAGLRERIDYRFLRLFATDRYKATEAELDAQAARSTFTTEDALAYLEKVRGVYFDGQLPIEPDLSYLDIGAGMGRLAIGLAAAGARDVTGVEIVRRHVAEAERIAHSLPPEARPQFVNTDIHDWTPRRRYDVIFVLGAMEHIHDPRRLLELLPSLLTPGGRAFVSHEPFEGPFGDHMSQFFRVPIPWRGLLFSERAILRLRREYFRPTDPATRYEDVVGGLNQMSFRTYLRYVREAGLEVVSHAFNPQVKHYPRLRPLYPLSWTLTHLPLVQGYFIMSAYSILARRA